MVELTVADIAFAIAAPTAAASLSRSSLPRRRAIRRTGSAPRAPMFGVFGEKPTSATPDTDFTLARTAPTRSASTSICTVLLPDRSARHDGSRPL